MQPSRTHLDHLEVKRRQFATAIPICVMLLGFAIYGCWYIEAPLDISLIVVGFAFFLLAMYTAFYWITGWQLRKYKASQNENVA
jgi:hypothetical protein